jgi:Bacterial extracellular solute-binding protein/von Willebrand factor type A domain
MGRHTSAERPGRRRTVILTISGLAILTIGSVFAVHSAGSNEAGDGGFAGNCDEPINVTVAAVPEVQPQVEAAAKALQGRDDGGACATFKVTAVAAAEVASQVAGDDKSRPDLWIPDSSLWIQRADDGQSLPAVAVPSLATSPVVLVGTDKSFATRSSWLDVFGNAQPNLLDPLTTATGAIALLALQAERSKTGAGESTLAQLLVPLAQRHGSMPKPFTDVNGLLSRAAASDAAVVVPASEQAFVQFQEKRPDSGLRALVPSTGTLMLDYPMVVTGKDDTGKITEAGKRLGQELRADAEARALDQAGFRNITNDPLSAGRGVGDLALLPKPDSRVASGMLQKWATLALSAHSLAVIDASSSMNTPVGGGKTWMDLTSQAAEAGMRLFPDNSQIGLWAITTKLSGPNRDWYPLVPIRRLDSQTKGHSQRVELLNHLHALKTKIGGSTGLYDAVLAAYRTVQDSYDPRSVNAVMIFTDGFSTNVRGLTLSDTLRSLEQLRDPARPIRLILIGMGPNVDNAALDKLARSTGGSAYLARNPSDINKVFIDALQNR